MLLSPTRVHLGGGYLLDGDGVGWPIWYQECTDGRPQAPGASDGLLIPNIREACITGIVLVRELSYHLPFGSRTQGPGSQHLRVADDLRAPGGNQVGRVKA